MSLERKLPLLMTGVLLIVLITGVIVVDREATRAAEVVTAHKVDETSRNIAELLKATPARVADVLRPISRDTVVRRVLTAPPKERDLALVRAMLAGVSRINIPSDSGMTTQLWARDGHILVSAGDTILEQNRPATAVTQAGRDQVLISSFYESGGRVFYWSTFPVTVNGERVGTLAQRRRLNSQPETEAALRKLSGTSAEILFRNKDGSLWTTIGGKPLDPPTDPDTDRGFPTFNHPSVTPGERALIYSAEGQGVPWSVAVELPVSKLGQSQRGLLTRFSFMSSALLILGAVAVWLISRRITSPLIRITEAAEAMARGDYSHRVPDGGDYETARLGEAFNRMATEVEAAKNKLTSAADAAEKAQVLAEDANAAKANFLAAMSHELRTPLNAIAGYVELLEMGIRGPLTEEQKADLGRIRKSQQYLLGLIEQVLVFTQLDAQKVAVHIEDVELLDLLRDTETMVRPQVSARGIEYLCTTDDPRTVIRADREKTQQILLNLVTNGAKYTEPGGRVTVSTRSHNGTVHVSVSDTGPGIPDKMLNSIFEPFVQLNRRLNQPREGVGLGLTISRDLARAMGGDLTVDSTLGVGSTFTLVLPRTETSRA
jgi:signal transduction histidine kinase